MARLPVNRNFVSNEGSEAAEDLSNGTINRDVGIGTDSPQQPLHVTGVAAADPQFALNQPVIIEHATRPGIQLVGSANNIGIIEFGDNAHPNAGSINFDHSTNRIRFGFEDDAEKVYIDSSGNMVIDGDLTVSGTTTTVSTTNTVLEDKLIELGNGITGTPSGDAGLIIERGSSTNAAIIWDESRDEFVLGTTSATGASTGDLTVTPGNVSVERIGAGTEQAEAEVHAKRDTASGVQYSTTATVIAEDDSRPSIQLAGGASNIGLIQFGDNAAVASGQIYYDHSTDKLRIDAGGNGDRVTVDADGDVVIAGDLEVTGDMEVTGGDLAFSDGQNATVSIEATDHNVAGRTLTITGGSTTAGTTNNIAGGTVTISAGQGKGTGAGGDILFRVANAGGSGSALNSHATALTISDDSKATFADDVAVAGELELGHASDTTLSRSSAGVLAVEGVVVPTISSTSTLTNKTLTAPRIADDGFIADANGNEQLVFVQTASAVNHWEMTNATSGAPLVTLQAAGDTADVNAVIKPKGEGVVAFIMTHANSTTAIKGASSGDAVLELQPDDGTAADQWTVSALDDGHFTIGSKISGSFVDMLEITPNATAANSSSALAGSLRTTGKLTSAGQVLAYAAKTANYETVATDHVIVASRGITITLVENAAAGTVFVIKRVDDGTSDGAITVSRDGSDTIDGETSVSLDNNYDTITVMSDGANYHTLSELASGGHDP